MANKKLDYSVETGDIAAPVAANGELLVAAGRSMGKAAEIEGTSNANNTAFLGNMALAATKGYLESEADKQVKGVLDNLVTSDDKGNIYRGKAAQARWDEHGSKAQASVLAANDLISQRDQMDDPTFLEGGGTGPINAEISAMRTEAQKWATAASNGNVDRDTAIAQIAAVVKKYSAMAPGWASDFRKIGAEATGISNIDVYGMHKLLTQQGLAEKQAAKLADIELRQTEAIMKANGYSSPSQVTMKDRREFQQQAQLATYVENKRKERELVTWKQEDTDKNNYALGQGYVAQALSGISSDVTRLYAAYGGADDSGKAIDAARVGAQVGERIANAHMRVLEGIRLLAAPNKNGQNAMSKPVYEALVKSVNEDFERYQNLTKTAEGLSLFKRIVDSAQGDANLLMAKIKLNNPLVTQHNTLGISQPFATAYVANPKAFRSMHGDKMANAYDSVMSQSPALVTSAFTNVVTGKSTVDDETRRNPTLGQITYNELVAMTKNVIDKGEGKFKDEKEKQRFIVGLEQWVGSTQFDPSKEAELEAFRKTFLHPAAQQLLMQLDHGERSRALAPLFRRLQTQVPADIGQVRQMIEQFNALPESREWGAKLELSYDTISGVIMPSLSYNQLTGGGGAGRGKPNSQLGDAVFSGQFAAWGEGRTARTMTGTQSDLRQRVAGYLSWLNTVPEVLEKALPLVNKDKTVNTFQSRTEIWRGLKEGGEVNLFEGKMGDAAGVPRNPSSSTPADWQAVNAREAAKAPERERDAILLRKREGVTAADAEQIRSALKMKGIGVEAKSILERELRLIEGALALP